MQQISFNLLAAWLLSQFYIFEYCNAVDCRIMEIDENRGRHSMQSCFASCLELVNNSVLSCDTTVEVPKVSLSKLSPRDRYLNQMDSNSCDMEVEISKLDQSKKQICVVSDSSLNAGITASHIISNKLCKEVIIGQILTHSKGFPIIREIIPQNLQTFITELKEANVKLILNVGSVLMHIEQLQPPQLSILVKSKESREQFATAIVKFTQQLKFGGINIFWVYPNCPYTKCIKVFKDKENLVLFCRVLAQKAAEFNLTLTLVTPNLLENWEPGYNLEELQKCFHYLVVQPYDGIDLAIRATTTFNSDFARFESYLNTIFTAGLRPEQTIIMVKPNIYQYTLKVEGTHGLIGSQAKGGDFFGYSYAEACTRFHEENYTLVRNTEKGQNYLYKSRNWYDLDDTATLIKKARIVGKYKNIGGFVYSTPDKDDFLGKCGCDPFPYMYTFAVGVAQSDSSCTIPTCL